MELEFDKYCIVDGSPTTVLPSSRRRSKVENRKSKGYTRCGNDLLRSNEDFTKISFHRYRSVSCKSTSSNTAPLEYNEVRKRGSVYQSSREVRLMRKNDAVEERKKIEFSQSNANALSFGIVNSLCSSEEDNSQVEQKRSSVMSNNSGTSAASSSRPHTELRSHDLLDISFHPLPRRGVLSDNFSEISFDSDFRDNQTENAEKQAVQDPKFRSIPVIVPLNDCNSLPERDQVASLPKSLSAKLALPHSPAQSESDCSRTSSPKARFGPIRKVFDPSPKSKLQRSPLSSSVEPQRENPPGLVTISRNKTFCRSLLHDFSNMGQRLECDSCSAKDNRNQLVQSTPAHLHGLLKLNRKHGVPLFEFSVRFPEDIFVARTWKAENDVNWIYTFHSVHERRKSNASGRGLKESHRVSSIVGQMQVSCYLCAELNDAGAFDNSMVTEFVLYDIAHPRKSVSSQDNSCCFSDVAKASDENSPQDSRNFDEACVKTKIKGQAKHGCNYGHSDSSTHHPLAAADLHPHLQIGAVVVQIPYEMSDLIPDCSSPVKVNVVIPSGNHSLPATESYGPSPLLDRWRLGGGCECGGWDMACPLNIFGSPNIQIAKGHLLVDNQQPLELFVQGKKETTPALTMTVMEDGQYAVDFHAQLSTLQAFSVCIAILHIVESSVSVRQEQNKQLLQSNSLRVFIEEEVKNLVDGVTEEEKCKDNKRTDEVMPSFIVNPPFSPIARV